MQHLLLKTTLPYDNLATEEYLLTCANNDYFMLWQNAPSVIIGCNQNAYAEVNLARAERMGVKIARRMTGGGAVYHDLGNINFSLIRNIRSDDPPNLYDMLCKPIIETLRQYEVEAKLGGRNDLIAYEKKIAGCAIRRYKERVLVHGAMLYSTDLDMLSSLLTPHSIKFDDKAVKSVSSRVANVHAIMPQKIPLPDFMITWATNAISIFGGVHSELNQEHQAGIALLAQKYADTDWIYGKVMPFSFRKIGKTAAGNVEIQIDFDRGLIKNIRIFGDFFGHSNVADLEQQLIQCPYNMEAIRNQLATIDLQKYMNNISVEELLMLMF